MQDWRADSFYEFGDIISLKSSLYFCLAFRTDCHPSEVSDWLKADEVCLTLPEDAPCGKVVLLDPFNKCFIFTNKWEEVCVKKNAPIIYSNKDPKDNEDGLFWVNEVEGTVFKKGEDWELINSGEEDVFEYPFGPTKLDDENDTSGNGVVTEGILWIDSKRNKVYMNIDASYKKSLWKRI